MSEISYRILPILINNIVRDNLTITVDSYDNGRKKRCVEEKTYFLSNLLPFSSCFLTADTHLVQSV
jgi:hypothetical protein